MEIQRIKLNILGDEKAKNSHKKLEHQLTIDEFSVWLENQPYNEDIKKKIMEKAKKSPSNTLNYLKDNIKRYI